MSRAGLWKNESHRQKLQCFPGKKRQRHARSVVKCPSYAKISLPCAQPLPPVRNAGVSPGCSQHRHPCAPPPWPCRRAPRAFRRAVPSPGTDGGLVVMSPPGLCSPRPWVWARAVPALPLPVAPGEQSLGRWPRESGFVPTRLDSSPAKWHHFVCIKPNKK